MRATTAATSADRQTSRTDERNAKLEEAEVERDLKV